MARRELTDGLTAAAEREKEFHPNRPNGAKITAWERRRNTLVKHAEAIEALEGRTNELEQKLLTSVQEFQKVVADLKSRPF